MRCGTSFFNKTVCKSCLKRYWPVWAALLMIQVLSLVLPVLSAHDFEDVSYIFRGLGGYGAVVMTFGFSAIAAMTVFSWMYNARSTGFTAALPLRRENLFCSSALAGFTMVAAPAVVTAVLLFLAAVGGGGAAALAMAGEWLAKYLLLTLCFFGFACLCAHLTGTLWVLPAVYVLLNVAVVVFWFLISYVLHLLLYGFGGDVPEAALDLSPIVRVFLFDWSERPFPDWLGLGAYAVFGVVCLALALLLAVRRRMESATDTVAVGWLKPVFRWVFAIGFTLCFSNLLYLIFFDEDRFLYVPMGIFLVLGAFIGWLIAEMLVRKSYKVRSCLKTFPILAVLLVLLVVFCACGGFGYATRVPAAESIRGADLNYRGTDCSTEDPAEIEIIRQIHRKLGAAGPADGLGVQITYGLKNGMVMSREFSAESLDEEDREQLFRLVQQKRQKELEDLLQEPGRYFSASVCVPDGQYDWFDLSDEQCRELIRSGLLPDAAEGKVDLVSSWALGYVVEYSEQACEVNLWSGKEGGRYASYDLQVGLEARRTWALLQRYNAAWLLEKQLSESIDAESIPMGSDPMAVKPGYIP